MVGKQGLEPRPPGPRPGTLPLTLHPDGGEGRNRTGSAALAGRARCLTCHPQGRRVPDNPVKKDGTRRHRGRPGCLPIWCSRYGRVNYPTCTRGLLGRSIRPEVNETARRDFSLGRLRARACSRLPGNHSAGQGSRKPRCRIHVSGPLRRLTRGHISMVSRWRKPGNRIFRGILRCGARAPGDGARIPVGGCGLSVWPSCRTS